MFKRLQRSTDEKSNPGDALRLYVKYLETAKPLTPTQVAQFFYLNNKNFDRSSVHAAFWKAISPDFSWKKYDEWLFQEKTPDQAQFQCLVNKFKENPRVVQAFRNVSDEQEVNLREPSPSLLLLYHYALQQHDYFEINYIIAGLMYGKGQYELCARLWDSDILRSSIHPWLPEFRRRFLLLLSPTRSFSTWTQLTELILIDPAFRNEYWPTLSKIMEKSRLFNFANSYADFKRSITGEAYSNHVDLAIFIFEIFRQTPPRDNMWCKYDYMYYAPYLAALLTHKAEPEKSCVNLFKRGAFNLALPDVFPDKVTDDRACDVRRYFEKLFRFCPNYHHRFPLICEAVGEVILKLNIPELYDMALRELRNASNEINVSAKLYKLGQCARVLPDAKNQDIAEKAFKLALYGGSYEAHLELIDVLQSRGNPNSLEKRKKICRLFREAFEAAYDRSDCEGTKIVLARIADFISPANCPNAATEFDITSLTLKHIQLDESRSIIEWFVSREQTRNFWGVHYHTPDPFEGWRQTVQSLIQKAEAQPPNLLALSFVLTLYAKKRGSIAELWKHSSLEAMLHIYLWWRKLKSEGNRNTATYVLHYFRFLAEFYEKHLQCQLPLFFDSQTKLSPDDVKYIYASYFHAFATRDQSTLMSLFKDFPIQCSEVRDCINQRGAMSTKQYKLQREVETACLREIDELLLQGLSSASNLVSYAKRYNLLAITHLLNQAIIGQREPLTYLVQTISIHKLEHYFKKRAHPHCRDLFQTLSSYCQLLKNPLELEKQLNIELAHNSALVNKLEHCSDYIELINSLINLNQAQLKELQFRNAYLTMYFLHRLRGCCDEVSSTDDRDMLQFIDRFAGDPAAWDDMVISDSLTFRSHTYTPRRISIESEDELLDRESQPSSEEDSDLRCEDPSLRSSFLI